MLDESIEEALCSALEQQRQPGRPSSTTDVEDLRILYRVRPKGEREGRDAYDGRIRSVVTTKPDESSAKIIKFKRRTVKMFEPQKEFELQGGPRLISGATENHVVSLSQ